MKIAIINQPFGTIQLPWVGKSGSIDIWIYEVARRLAKSCEVIVYTRREEGQKEVEFDQNVCYRRVSTALDEWYPRVSYILKKFEKIPITSTLARTINHLFFFREPKRPFFFSPFYYPNYIIQIAKDLRKQKCDIVHIFNFSQFAPIIRAFNPQTKIVLDMSCEWLTVLDRRLIKKRLRYVDLIIGCSKYIGNSIRRAFPKLAKRCAVPDQNNGVDVNVFVDKNIQSEQKENNEKQLLFVGRISPEKGIHVLLEAFHEVIKQYPNTCLKIVGPKHGLLPRDFLLTLSNSKNVQDLSQFYDKLGNNYFSYLQKQLHSLNIADKVIFTGFVPNSQMRDYYQVADVLINPSFSESFGRSLVEAMSCEVPVIASKIGGMLEIVENYKTGILVEPGDVFALTKAIICLLQDEHLMQSMGTAARKRVIEVFSWEKVVDNLLNEYNKICDVNAEQSLD